MSHPEAFKLVGFIPKDSLEPVCNAVFATGAGVIGNYDCCSWRTLGTGTFRGGESSNPSVGARGEFEQVEEWRVEFRCAAASLAGAVNAFVAAHPYEEPAYDVYALWNTDALIVASPPQPSVQGEASSDVSGTPTLFSTPGTATLSFDGGSRGNPGPAAGAWVIVDDAGNDLESGGEFLGDTTNNVAEYTACVRGLERALELGVSDILIRGDSELIIKQIRGEYKVKNADLKPLHARAVALLDRFNTWGITHVPRSENAEADALVNQTLDANA